MPYKNPHSETALENKRRNNSSYQQRQRETNAEDFHARDRERCKRYRERHPERSREASRLGQQRYREQYPERSSASLWASSLRRNYGIGPDEFDALLSKQNGRCAICGTDDPGTRKFNVDHDHETGKIRGILCQRCNLAIGHFKDNLDIMENAMRYVRSGGV